MDSGPKASLCHGEHVRVQRMSCRVLEGFTFVHRVDRKRVNDTESGACDQEISAIARARCRAGATQRQKGIAAIRNAITLSPFPLWSLPIRESGKKDSAMRTPGVATDRLHYEDARFPPAPLVTLPSRLKDLVDGGQGRRVANPRRSAISNRRPRGAPCRARTGRGSIGAAACAER